MRRRFGVLSLRGRHRPHFPSPLPRGVLKSLTNSPRSDAPWIGGSVSPDSGNRESHCRPSLFDFG